MEVNKIWDAAPHNAFTGLIYFKDRWFCAFREGKAHVSPDGALRVITSVDGTKWESAALIRSDLGDLRDAKLTLTPAGKLMLAGAVAVHQPSPVRHKSLVWFSDDGKSWSDAKVVGDDNYWLWRVTFTGDNGYGIGYRTVAPRSARLYVTKDNGQSFETLVPKLEPTGWAGEHDISFARDGTATCLLRRDPPPKAEAEGLDAAAKAGHAVVGTAKPPYSEWVWKDLGVRVGGPALVRLHDGRLLAVVRLYDKKARTSICQLDAENGKLTELLPLPSGGDTSYAGIVVQECVLWISYYSSHEGKTSIYLAKVDAAK
ncbi:exo-alpha-sialidase [Humisphaera borealis]|uniref:Exo-alpha-sialidase n=1 Tax=Humisphaera borealis TaxID=2807512 RepID=A0A7M2X653_9BACT|nr:exo-alpha-sialidase [Humisphaera borealis]